MVTVFVLTMFVVVVSLFIETMLMVKDLAEAEARAEELEERIEYLIKGRDRSNDN